jgi:3-hydroxyisobutyrate dehydrogenase
MPFPQSIAIIGFGEVGRILAQDLKQAGVPTIAVYDTAFADPASGAAQAADLAPVVKCTSATEAVAGADLVISAVTAGSAIAAARSVIPAIGNAYFMDVNSISPSAKRQAGEEIDAAGGRYVEAAVMASVPPKRIRTPMLFGGRFAEGFLPIATALGFSARVYSSQLGAASSVKMCRSIMVKGLEALALECMLTSRAYGVEADVLSSLADTLPHPDWPGLARYLISRSLLHGKRRAEEMREVARTVSEAGLDPLLAAPTAERQDWAYEQAALLPAGMLANSTLATLLDGLLDQRVGR